VKLAARTFTYLLGYVADSAATITEPAQGLVRPRGAMARLEFAVPPKLLWRGWWWLYTAWRSRSPALGRRAWFGVG
jgi:hypothetical protein